MSRQFKAVFNIPLISLIRHFVFISNSQPSLWRLINFEDDISPSAPRLLRPLSLGSSQPGQNWRPQILLLLPRRPSPFPSCPSSHHRFTHAPPAPPSLPQIDWSCTVAAEQERNCQCQDTVYKYDISSAAAGNMKY